MTEEREWLKDLFVRSGTVSDPSKFYHLEFICASAEEAERAEQALAGYGIAARRSRRRGHEIVYLKDAEAISDILTAMGAHNAVLKLQNVRVYKDVKGNVQRRVNCETANIHKTVSASVRQVGDIELIRDRIGIHDLPVSLQEVALLRLAHPEATLSELAQELPELGKSGINHRLRRISKIAAQLKQDAI